MNSKLKFFSFLLLLTFTYSAQSSIKSYNWTGTIDFSPSTPTPDWIIEVGDLIYGTLEYDNIGSLVEDYGTSSLYSGANWTYVIDNSTGDLAGGFSNANIFVSNGTSDLFQWEGGSWSGDLIDTLSAFGSSSTTRLT